MQVGFSIIDNNYGIKLPESIYEEMDIEENKLYITIKYGECYIHTKEVEASSTLEISKDLMIYLPKHIVGILKVKVSEGVCLIIKRNIIIVKKGNSTKLDTKSESVEDILYEKNELILEEERRKVIETVKAGRFLGCGVLDTMLDFHGTIIDCENEEILEILNDIPNSLKILAHMWYNDEEVSNLRERKLIEYAIVMKSENK